MGGNAFCCRHSISLKSHSHAHQITGLARSCRCKTLSAAAAKHQRCPQSAPEKEACAGTTLRTTSNGEPLLRAGAVLAVLLLCVLAVPDSAEATEMLPTNLFHAFLDEIEALGNLGPVLFVACVVLAEMVPLFPTQPLALASGLLFGGKEGAVFVLLGSTLAATLAFTLARTVGEQFIKGIIERESDSESAGPIKSKMQAVQEAIETGGFWQQLTAITFLRLTPVVPYTASNYLLGMTPLRLPAFLGGTVAGMAVWSALYASLGGAGRALLGRGADVDTLLADMAEKAAEYSEEAGAAALVVGSLGAAYWYFSQQQKPDSQGKP